MVNTRKLALIILFFLFALGQVALAAGKWELRVCAEPNDFPASNDRLEGFENRIAQILADDLGASLSYVWLPTTVVTVRDHMSYGECDMIMGVPDDFFGLLGSNAYYQIPHVFVYRQDSPYQIQSVEDEALKGLKVGTYPLSLTDLALRNQGVTPMLFHPTSILSQVSTADPLIQALRNGSIDTAIISGAVAGQFAKQYPGELRILPVSPEIAPPLLPMFQIGTIGVRRGDVSLRDELNLAIARQWDAIQKVFESYGVPLLPLPRPVLPQPVAGLSLKVGAIIPVPSSTPAPTDRIGAAARQGTVIADDLLGREAIAKKINLKIFMATSPSLEAGLRAARRLVAVEGISAIIGGFSPEDVRGLGQIASESKVLFLNVATQADALRQTCSPNTFHLEASEAMYLDSIAGWFASQKKRRWFLLYPTSEVGKTLYSRAIKAITAAGGKEVGKVALPPNQRIFTAAIETIQRTKPEVVLSLLDPANQDFLLAQIGAPIEGVSIVHFPFPATQTRAYWRQMVQSAAVDGQTYRPVLWDPVLVGAAKDLNDQYGSRSGVPMDSSAWTVYAGIKLLLDSVATLKSSDSKKLAAYLADPKTSFDLFKGVPLSFRSWDHQLRQPLYMVQANRKAEIGVKLSQQIPLARLIAQLPEKGTGNLVSLLDRMGDPKGAGSCTR